jgi:hypothetical protein
MLRLRIILGFLVAPVIPSLLLGTYFAATRPAIAPPLTLSGLIDPGLTEVAYCVALLAGGPAFLILRRRPKVFWWQFIIGGAVLGAIPALLMALFRNPWSMMGLMFGVPYGALAGVAFWLICFSGRRRGSAI